MVLFSPRSDQLGSLKKKWLVRACAAARRCCLPACVMLIVVLLNSAAISSEDLRCHVCGTVIPAQGKYFQAKGSTEVYCERCFSSAPRCTICKLPKSPSEIDPDTGVCQKCLEKLPRCKSCGKPIVGVAYTYPFGKGIYCAECRTTYPACYICGVPVGPQHWEYPDGRVICNECGERAVFDIGDIERIMQDVQATVVRRLGLQIRNPYQLKVEKLEGFRTSDSEPRTRIIPGHSPLYGRELGMYRRTGDRSEIYLLFGLPPELLYEAGAHEYAHAWQAENYSTDVSPELREGFAQWVAADVLRAKGFRSALEKLELRDDVPYGTGYQRLRRLSLRTIASLLQNGR